MADLRPIRHRGSGIQAGRKVIAFLNNGITVMDAILEALLENRPKGLSF